MDAFVAKPGAMAGVFDVVELSDGERVAFGDLAMEAVATVHGIETYGFRATAAGRTRARSRSPRSRRAPTRKGAAPGVWC
jgi:hypothetical protein